MKLRSLTLPILLVALAAAAAPEARAQNSPLALHTDTEDAGGAPAVESRALARGRYAVVVDLDRNRLFFKKGDLTLWSAPIGTGTGLRLESGEREWDFSTPNGVFQVKLKEQNPVWVADDWYFIENGLEVPPPNDKRRIFPGGLGAAAVYIDHDLAIHGTDKPELLGQRVSHGCIRLSNRDALRLFHNVQVGTEVVIVGGQRAAEEAAAAAEEAAPVKLAALKKGFDPARPKRAPEDPVLSAWRQMHTEDLLAVLDNEFWLAPEVSRWTEVAGLLVERGVRDEDDQALAGLLAAAADLPSARVEREYATFLADLYARAPLRTLREMAGLDGEPRESAARSIVEATLDLFPGEFDEPSTPWPTRRIPATALEPGMEAGWSALAEAEADFRRGSRVRRS